MPDNELEQQGSKITQKNIAAISGLSTKTIRKHLNSQPIDIDEMVEMVNNSFSER